VRKLDGLYIWECHGSHQRIGGLPRIKSRMLNHDGHIRLNQACIIGIMRDWGGIGQVIEPDVLEKTDEERESTEICQRWYISLSDEGS
jgi:hypothetical protein